MRVLQVLWDGGGNVPMQLAIARALVSREHEVRVLASTSLREGVETSGAAFVPFRRAPDVSMSSPHTDPVGDWKARTFLGSTARYRDHLIFGPALEFARDVLAELERNPADIVAFDYLLLGAGIGAEKAGVRTAALIHNPYPLPEPGIPPFGLGLMPARGALGRLRDRGLHMGGARLLKSGLNAANAARDHLGLQPLDRYDAQLRRCDRLLVLTSPELDFGARANLPGTVRYVGPVLDRGERERSAGADWPAADGRPLVVASFGTTYQRQEGLVRRVARALGEVTVRALLTTGPAIDPDRISPPPNVDVCRFVPHWEVMPHAKLVVCHGGLGTVHAALSHGVPLICMPHGRDQGDNAARVVAAGAGLRVSRFASTRRIRSAVQRALADDSLRCEATRMARSFGCLDGAAGAVRELEALAGTRPD
jgi:UDP:flavonoid glycosyltransferase YjiC (YdhE family)